MAILRCHNISAGTTADREVLPFTSATEQRDTDLSREEQIQMDLLNAGYAGLAVTLLCLTGIQF